MFSGNIIDMRGGLLEALLNSFVPVTDPLHGDCGKTLAHLGYSASDVDEESVKQLDLVLHFFLSSVYEELKSSGREAEFSSAVQDPFQLGKDLYLYLNGFEAPELFWIGPYAYDFRSIADRLERPYPCRSVDHRHVYIDNMCLKAGE